MAKTATTATPEISEAAAAARNAIASRPRQSQVKLVELFVTISETAPERIKELFGDQAEVLAANVDRVENKVQTAIERVIADQSSRAIRLLESTDPQNGYAGFQFDQETFDEKLRPKVGRSKKSTVEKAADLLSEASDADLEALKQLLAARGL